MRRACLITLLAFAAISCAAASRILEDDAAAMGRELLQNPANLYECSKWCLTNQCIRVGTTGLTKCNKCQNNLKPILSGKNAGQCGCPAGTYFKSIAVGSDSEPGDCIPCEFGSYCNKQLTLVEKSATGEVGKWPCGVGFTTRARRSTSVWDCVNLGGWYLANGATGPVAHQCEGDTYAIAKSKQTSCTPCPTRFEVVDKDANGDAATDPRNRPTSCKVPPGYFLKSPGQVAPCDQGSYQPKYLGQTDAAVGSCTPCPEGVTTADKGSKLQSDCKNLKPGYVATLIEVNKGITEATLCPQGFFCPGGADATQVTITGLDLDGDGNVQSGGFIAGVDLGSGNTASAKITQCPNRAWTKSVGATAVDQCMIPPGFEVTGTNDISACTSNTYRSEWISVSTSGSKACVSCGSDVSAAAIDPVTLYSLNTGVGVDKNTDYIVVNTLVKATSKSCYIKQGQGLYYVVDATKKMVYKARNCGAGTDNVANSYGVYADTFGLAQTPCKLCPAGTVVDSDNPPSKGFLAAGQGFYDPQACVTKPGYGYDGRVATLCPKGWYNAGNNYLACTQCGYGLTTGTPSDSALKTTADNCLAAAGFGEYYSKMQLCPAGTFAATDRARGLCTTCLDNSWTAEEGSDAASDCSVCAPGYGAIPGSNPADVEAGCKNKKCGGDLVEGSYGPADREGLECLACAKTTVGFQFFYDSTSDLYIPPTRAKEFAQDAADCVAGMAQIEDGLWYLDGAETEDDVGKANNRACADRCLAVDGCALATYDYSKLGASGSCKILTISENTGVVITAFKAVPSSDVSQSRKLQAAKPKAVSTGMYTQYKYAGTALLTAVNNVKQTLNVADLAACFDKCDALDSCAAVVYDGSSSCKTIEGVTAPDSDYAAMRSLTRAVPSKFAI